MTKCLHDARLAGERQFIEKSREKRKSLEEKWKRIDEEEFGEDGILRKIIERHQAKKNEALKVAEAERSN